MSIELATAYISVVASTGDLKDSVRQAFDGSKSVADKGGRGLGSKLLGGVGSVLKGGALAIGATVAAGVGTALVKGFGRLTALDQANATLTGLGHSAESVDQIMANALASVKGTAFGLGDAGQVAASAVAAGVKPGKDLERTLKLVADSATIAGTDLGSMGAIFGKVAASNKVQMDVINQLQDAGVPALALLADQLGVTAEKASEMASRGEIDFATFQAAMEGGLGGAALASGDTFSGALDNVGAALGRVGANFLGPVFLAMPPLFQAIAEALGPIEGAAGSVGEKLAAFLVPAIESLAGFLRTVDLSAIFEMVASFSPLSLIFQTLGPLMPVIAHLFGMIAAAVIPLAQTLAAQLVPVITALIPIFGGILAAILPVIGTIIGALVPVIAQLAPIFLNVINAILPLVAMILPLLSALLAAVVPIFMELLNAVLPIIAPILALVAPLLQMVGAILKPLISLIVMLVGVALKPMMMAVRALIGPILSVVGVIASSLVPIINAITTVLKGVVAFITGVFTGNWKQAWNGIVQIFSGIFNGIKGVVRGVMNVVIDLINGAIGGINDIAGAVSDATGGAINLKIGKIPRLAQGGVINRSAGGSIVNVGEGRYDEAVIPLSPNVLSQIGEAMGGSSSLPESLTLVVDGRPMRAYIAEGVAANDRLQGQRLSMGWAN
mgnify:CR=1 FL=1